MGDLSNNFFPALGGERGEGRSQVYKKGRIEISYSQRIYITACFEGGLCLIGSIFINKKTKIHILGF